MEVVLPKASRGFRIGVVGLVSVMTILAVSTDTADARRRRHVAGYNPPYATIIVDANTGKTLQATNPDSPRHPASLTKIMTLYLLFERLESGKIKLDSDMAVSEHASEQAPTKLGLREGQSLAVEDAIKGLVTKSANDAAVVIAEAIGGSEEQFAKMMTQKARALGMTKTVYTNASGLPDEDQVTTARDQATLGRAIQERFPSYYRYFATSAFRYRGNVIRNHNRLIGRVEGVDGIKTGYTRASGFNLVTSMRRGNRHIVGVVLGGRSGGSRDAAMRELVAEYIAQASQQRTASAIAERTAPTVSDTHLAATDIKADSKPGLKFVEPAPKPAKAAAPVQLASASAEIAPTAAKPEPAPLSSGVVSQQALLPIPGSSDPITPTKVKTFQVKAGATKTAAVTATATSQSAPVQTASIPRNELPQVASNHGTGQGILGVLPASAMAYADPAPKAAAPAVAVMRVASAPAPAAAPATKPVVRSGWIIQVGAFDAASEARQRLDAARGQVKQLGKADPFTEPVAKGDKTMYRARFAGLDKDDAEAACRALKRSDISCFTIKN